MPATTQPRGPDPSAVDDHESVYDGLLGGDSSQWAFGTDFEDPLAGVDTTVPDGVDGADLAAYCLMLGDDALVLSHRLSEWCSRAPDLEDDIALANIALDLLGQARLLLARAAAADPAVVPALPDGSPVPDEDALAFFREAGDFRNVRLAEVPHGDFAHVVVPAAAVHDRPARAVRPARRQPRPGARRGRGQGRQGADLPPRLRGPLVRDARAGHRGVAAPAARRARRSCGRCATSWSRPTRSRSRTAAAGVGVDPAAVADAVDGVLDQVLAAAGVERPAARAARRASTGAPAATGCTPRR